MNVVGHNEHDYQNWLRTNIALERKWVYRRSETWTTSDSVMNLSDVKVLDMMCGASYVQVLIDGGNAITQVSLSNRTATVTACGVSLPSCTDAIEWVKSTILPVANADDTTIAVRFWTLGGGSGRDRNRTLDAPLWSAISDNYPERTRSELARMAAARYDLDAGKLILWHGAPGTGKTTAIRALAQSWKPWAVLHYILDPERFFGDATDYMMNVLLNESEDWPPPDVGESSKWRILVLEDTGELLTKDAKLTNGQALSRLLGVCDGMVGQGLKILVLITSNEDIGVMHEAVIRPGRCVANVKFEMFSESDAKAWLTAHDADYPVDMLSRGAHSLASLYARLGGDVTPAKLTPAFGF